MTTRSENAMVKAAIIGLKYPIEAKGIAMMLYANAQNKFCLMVK